MCLINDSWEVKEKLRIYCISELLSAAADLITVEDTVEDDSGTDDINDIAGSERLNIAILAPIMM